MHNYSLFLFNVVCNSFLTFWTTAAFVALLLYIGRLRPGRFSSFLWMLPFIKLLLDLFYYDFSSWAHLQGIDPCTLEAGTRQLTIGWGLCRFYITFFILFSLTSGYSFTLADMIAKTIPSTALIGCMSLIFSISLYRLYKTVCHMRIVLPIGTEALIKHPLLRTTCKKLRIRVLSIEEPIPASYGLLSHVVTMPTQTFSSKEWDAILAHELEHCRFKDNLSRYLIRCIQSFFWWVPTKWVYTNVEKGQEIACDRACLSYGIDPVYVASSLRRLATTQQSGVASFFKGRSICTRVEMLLSMHKTQKKSALATAAIAILAFFSILLGKFWIF